MNDIRKIKKSDIKNKNISREEMAKELSPFSKRYKEFNENSNFTSVSNKEKIIDL